MKLFARLISHAFAIALVVLLAIGFIYRGELFPELELPGAVATQPSGVVAVDEPTQPGLVSGKITRPSPEVPATGKDRSRLKETTPEAGMAPGQPLEVPDTDAAGIKRGDDKGAAGVAQPLVKERQRSVLRKKAGPADVPVPASPAELPVDETATLSRTLQGLAREAYWMRDFEAAEHYYRRMISVDPENPDGYGELANLYLSLGNRKAAATGYYEAGLRLTKRGLTAPAMGLAGVLRELSDSRAEALERAIEAAPAVTE